MKVTLTKNEAGEFKFGTDVFRFTMDDVLTAVAGGPTLKLPFEDYQIPLIKVEMRPLGESVTIWKGFGHTVPIQDGRLSSFSKKTGLAEDPLANFDGARKWDQRWGFKRLVKPKPQLVITDLSTANEIAELWLNNQRGGWIPLQNTGNKIAPTKVNHYGLAFSYLQPSPEDEHYQAEITFYVKFRQFAWTSLNDPGTPNLCDLPPNVELTDILDDFE